MINIMSARRFNSKFASAEVAGEKFDELSDASCTSSNDSDGGFMMDEVASLLAEIVGGEHPQRQPITILGGATMDVVATTGALPVRGGDLAVQMSGMHLGGCALNVALGLKQLGCRATNLLPLGQGPWADRLRKGMHNRGIHSELDFPEGNEDNGWCVALVEKGGERTFISFDGLDNYWRPEWLPANLQQGLLYLTGYQFSAPCAPLLTAWVEQLPQTVKVMLDFGPRIDIIAPDLVERLIRPGVILNLNQREAQYLGMGNDIRQFCRRIFDRTKTLVIVRNGSDGGYYFGGEEENGWVPSQRVTVVDTTGAGDSHCAGLLAGLSMNLTFCQSMMLGNAVAGYVVARVGADCAPTLAELVEPD